MFDIFGMRHHGLHSLLSSYADGQVTVAEAERVERHLAACEESRVDLESLRATVGLLRLLPELTASRSFRLTEIPETRPIVVPFAYTRPLMAAASVAAVLVVALVAFDLAGVGGPAGSVVSDRTTSVSAESFAEAGLAAEAPVAGEAAEPVAETANEQVQIEMAVVEEIEEVESEKIAEIEVTRVLESEFEIEPEIAQIAEITEEHADALDREAVAIEEPDGPDDLARDGRLSKAAASEELIADTQIQAEALLPESLSVAADDDAPFGADAEAAFGAEPSDAGFPYLPLEIAAGALLALLVAVLLVVRRRRA